MESDKLSPDELQELQRLSAPGSLRRYLVALRDARLNVACGEVGVGSRISFGIAKGSRLMIDVTVEPARKSA